MNPLPDGDAITAAINFAEQVVKASRARKHNVVCGFAGESERE